MRRVKMIAIAVVGTTMFGQSQPQILTEGRVGWETGRPVVASGRMRLSVEIDPATSRVGTPLIPTLRIKNISGEVMVLGDYGLRTYELRVMDSKRE